jgi:hypothetical protein
MSHRGSATSVQGPCRGDGPFGDTLAMTEEVKPWATGTPSASA